MDNTILILAILFSILLIIAFYLPKSLLRFFFGDDEQKRTPAEIIKFIGFLCGTIIVVLTLSNGVKSIELTQKGQLDTRFKDAALLLANDNTSANLSGIYALHQIAIDASKRKKDQKGYIDVVQNILCAYIRENSQLKVNDSILIIRQKPEVIFQTIVDVLINDKYDIHINGFLTVKVQNKNSNSNMYKEENLNFSKSDFSNFSFDNIDLNGVSLTKANLRGANLRGASISNANLNGADLRRTDLSRASIYETDLRGANLNGADLSRTRIYDVDLSEADLRGVDLTNTSKCNFYKKYLDKDNWVIHADENDSMEPNIVANLERAIVDDENLLPKKVLEVYAVEEIEGLKRLILK